MSRREDLSNDILLALHRGDQEKGVYGLDLWRILGCSIGAMHSTLERLRTRQPPLIEARWEGEKFPSQGGGGTRVYTADGGSRRYFRLVPMPNEDTPMN